MANLTFDSTKPFDLICVGRVTIDLNPLDFYKPLTESETFHKYLGGSPANIAVGMARLGKKVGFVGKKSADQFGDFLCQFLDNEGIDTTHLTSVTNGAKTGLTFTEMLSETQSSILMYRDEVADLYLSVDDICEDYIASTKLLLLSGTALSRSPSREAVLKALNLAQKHNIPVVFDIDFREYTWKNKDEIAIYYNAVASKADVLLGSREEYDLTEAITCPGLTDPESARHWFSHNAKICVIKHGKEGSTAYTKDGGVYSIKPFPVKLLKGFGGGDGYASAFLYGLLQGWDIMDCLEFGSASASLLINSHSCASSMPTVSAIKEFIKTSKEQYGESVVRG